MATWTRAPAGRITDHFAWAEARCRHCGKIPDAETVREAAAWLEKVRIILGRPVKVLSWCRCPVHNAAIGGKSHSYHLKGMAVDIVCKDLSAPNLRDFLRPHHTEGGLIGGLGAYPGFTHVDRGPFRSWSE